MTLNLTMEGTVKMWIRVPRGVMAWILCKRLQVRSRAVGPLRNVGPVESAKRAHKEVQR
jgi:hypothetical protein